MVKKACSFLKKRTDRRFETRSETKVFCFFFSKKKALLR